MNELLEHTLILRLFDRPGAMEAITATFAHRGISLCCAAGNDGATSPDGYASIVVHFRATTPHKETIKRVLSRLSRVVSVTEPTADGVAARICAMVRLTPEATLPDLVDNATSHISLVTRDPETDEAIYSLIGPIETIGPFISNLQQSGKAKTITQVLLAL